MTTSSPANTPKKAREALTSHLLSWRNKHGLSVAAAHQMLMAHMQQEEQELRQKLKPKPKAQPRKPQLKSPVHVRPVVVRFRSIEDERIAQEAEGRARAAQEK